MDELRCMLYSELPKADARKLTIQSTAERKLHVIRYSTSSRSDTTGVRLIHIGIPSGDMHAKCTGGALP